MPEAGNIPEDSQDDDDSTGLTPAEVEKFSEAQSGHYTVRFEPFTEDTTQIWIEVASVHIATHGPFSIDKLDEIGKNITATCSFAIERCKGFLDQFDIK